MTSTDAGLHVRPMDQPDERMEPPLTRVDVTTLGGTTLMRIAAEPGWRWSTSVGPSAGTKSCELPHTGYMISGRLGIRMDDGTEGELITGDAFTLAAGHDGWVVGDEPVVLLEIAPTVAQE